MIWINIDCFMTQDKALLSFIASEYLPLGNVEKSHQQRSRHFVVLTYWKYAPRVKIAAAFPSA
jgi:hypothetical protein